MYMYTHMSETKVLYCQLLKSDFFGKDEVYLFYKDFIFRQLLAKTRWKLSRVCGQSPF